MGRREKILITMMVLALGFGVFEFLYSPPQQEMEETAAPEEGVQEIQSMAQNLGRDLQDSELKEAEEHILEMAASEWDRNIFRSFPETESVEEPVQEEEVHEAQDLGALSYSGYLEMGEKRIAVINSEEYTVGDMLEQENAQVRKITPDRVLVRSLRTGEEVWVPYTD